MVKQRVVFVKYIIFNALFSVFKGGRADNEGFISLICSIGLIGSPGDSRNNRVIRGIRVQIGFDLDFLNALAPSRTPALPASRV